MMKHAYILLCAAALSAACDKASRELPDAAGSQETEVSVSMQGQKTAPGIVLDAAAGSDAIIIDSFDEGSLLYFSQLGPASDPNFEDESEEKSPYLYIYAYNERTANWAEGYNFSLYGDRKAFDWEMVKSIGSVGNAFSLYAFYFPVGNRVKFSVEENQAGAAETPYDTSNFMKSDIMGAYHATSSLYTRLRFRLFHLMVYLKVTIYVPVYEDNLSGDHAEASYSGFKAGALKGAFVMNANTDFTIEWHANRSSDTEAPLVRTTDGSQKNITMYRHEGDEERILEEFDVRGYYDKEGALQTDRVREYSFSVLFPSQTFADNFLCFALQAPDESMKYYYFSGSQIMGESGDYRLTQGTLQQLYLYLPRTTNETVLVGANILPWSDASTDMTVTQQPGSGQQEENDDNDD